MYDYEKAANAVKQPMRKLQWDIMLINTFADSGGHIIDGGSGIPYESRPENVEAMTETVFDYGARR